MDFSQGHSGTKAQCESCLFSQGKTPEFTKMGEIHELFVLPLSLVWFAGGTPDKEKTLRNDPFVRSRAVIDQASMIMNFEVLSSILEKTENYS